MKPNKQTPTESVKPSGVAITNAEILELSESLNKISNIGDAAFMFFVSKNIGILKPFAKAIIKTKETISKGIEDFVKSRNELIVKYGTDTDEGKKIKPSDANWPKYKKDLDELSATHKDAIDKHDSEMKQFIEEVLQETETIEFRTKKLEDCPDEGFEGTMPILVQFGLIVE